MPEAAVQKKTKTAKRRTVDQTVRRAARLAPDVALLVRDGRRNGRARPVEVARILDDPTSGAGPELTLGSGKRLKIPRERWQEVRGDLKALVREEIAPLDAEVRESLLEELAGAMESNPSFELSTSLHWVREVLRERLPLCAVSESHPAGLAVEAILAVDENSFWISGWLHDEDGRGEVTVVSPEGARHTLTEIAHRYERPDVRQFYSGLGTERTREHGFTAYFSLEAPSLLSSGWVAELQTTDGVQLEIQCPNVIREPEVVRSTILGELGGQGPVGGPLAAEHGRPALTRLQQRIVGEARIDSVDEYGRAPRNPEVSIVVPLYKRLDFIEHQLLQLSRDPDLAEAELIYVLDSSEQAEELAQLARQLFGLYQLPFRVVNLSSGAGFAGANNQGIEISRGSRLLLLNSDVVPDRPGWLGTLREFHEATPDIGALGPKLLYEDDSIQHAGLYFHRAGGAEVWENAHCFKGLHRTFPAANVARPMPAVTAACMMVDRDLYDRVGGLPLHYVQGDYEDSELCLRLAEEGKQNWYLPAVELYHLEGQSYVPGVRRIPSEYNQWLHTSLWGERIEDLMAGFDAHAAADPTDRPATEEARELERT
jgi:O-antigen biosynthesis protein